MKMFVHELFNSYLFKQLLIFYFDQSDNKSDTKDEDYLKL